MGQLLTPEGVSILHFTLSLHSVFHKHGGPDAQTWDSSLDPDRVQHPSCLRILHPASVNGCEVVHQVNKCFRSPITLFSTQTRLANGVGTFGAESVGCGRPMADRAATRPPRRRPCCCCCLLATGHLVLDKQVLQVSHHTVLCPAKGGRVGFGGLAAEGRRPLHAEDLALRQHEEVAVGLRPTGPLRGHLDALTSRSQDVAPSAPAASLRTRNGRPGHRYCACSGESCARDPVASRSSRCRPAASCASSA